MNLQLGTIDRRGSAWWYVRPELLASLIALLVICLIVWAVTKTHLTGVKQLVHRVPVIELASSTARSLSLK